MQGTFAGKKINSWMFIKYYINRNIMWVHHIRGIQGESEIVTFLLVEGLKSLI